VVRARFKNELVGRGTVLGLACVATLVICPVARACYYVLFLPAIPFVSGRLLELGKPRYASFFAWLPVALVWLHYLLLPTSGRIGLLGLGATAWFLATCVLLQRRPRLQPEIAEGSLDVHQTREPEREPLLLAT
jgi:hypothetical protein